MQKLDEVRSFGQIAVEENKPVPLATSEEVQ
jgi:hypothetical protein